MDAGPKDRIIQITMRYRELQLSLDNTQGTKQICMYCVFCAHYKDENAKFHIQSRTEKSRASLIKKFSQN
jgi:hypothetical protein